MSENPYTPPDQPGGKHGQPKLWPKMGPVRYGVNVGCSVAILIFFVVALIGARLDRLNLIMRGYGIAFIGFVIAGVVAAYRRAKIRKATPPDS